MVTCTFLTRWTIAVKWRRINMKALPERYNCGPVQLSGEGNAFYERHVTFDHVVPRTEATGVEQPWVLENLQIGQTIAISDTDAVTIEARV